MRKFLKTVKSLTSFIWDLLVMYTPVYLVYKHHQPGVAFLVHPRDITDIYRPFPFFKHLPEEWTRWIGCRFGAITLSKMDLPSDVNGDPIRSYLLSIVMDPQSMKEHPDQLKRNLRRLSRLAQRKNLHLVALGALLPSVSGYGKVFTDLQREDSGAPMVTTGHICTAWCISAILSEIAAKRHSSRTGFKVGVLGAAGSTGTLATHMLQRLREKEDWFFDIKLVDKNARRLERVTEATPGAVASTDISLLKDCDYVVVVTNASDIVLRPQDVKSGAVVIDDTQPRATSPNLGDKAFVVDVLARVEGLNANFNFGIKANDRGVTFSCLAEMVILGAVGHNSNFAVGPAATGSPEGAVERFFEYLETARSAGIKFDPVTNVSFAQLMDPSVHEQMMQSVESPYLAAE